MRANGSRTLNVAYGHKKRARRLPGSFRDEGLRGGLLAAASAVPAAVVLALAAAPAVALTAVLVAVLPLGRRLPLPALVVVLALVATLLDPRGVVLPLLLPTLLESNAPPTARLSTATMLSAALHFRGFSRATIHPQRRQPEIFDYQSVSGTSMWNPTAGSYTRYGAVESLLRDPDDRMLIMGSGDEVRLRFSALGLPPLPSGWKRDFLLLVDGWAKDADANTAFSQTVNPLPFHGMSRYPYPAGEHYPQDRIHQDYLREYNTRPALRLNQPLRQRAS